MMTISRKLAFMVFCAFGTQITYPSFRAYMLKEEIDQIVEFVDQLLKYNTLESKKAAKWLKKQLHGNGTQVLNHADVVEIARAVGTTTTIDTKIAIIQGKMIEKMQEEKIAEEKKSIEHFTRYANNSVYFGSAVVSCVVAFLGGMGIDTILRYIADSLNNVPTKENLVDARVKRLQAQKTK